MHKSDGREAYTQEIQEVFKLTLLDTLVTLVGTPSSGSTSDNTCTHIFSSLYLWYIERPQGYPEMILLAPGRSGKKDDHGKESVQETEVTTGKRSARANARKHAQRKATAGGRTTRTWEKNLA
jgi:hypothetical protein